MSKVQKYEDQLRKGGLSDTEKATILNNLGFEYYNLTQYKIAIEKHMQALKILPSSEKDQKLQAYRSIGENYRLLKKFKKGLQYCQQHLEICLSNEKDLEIQRSYCNLGLLYADQADYLLQKNMQTEFQTAIEFSIYNLEKSTEKIISIINKNGNIQGGKAGKNIEDSNFQIQLKQMHVESLYNQANALFIKGKWESTFYKESETKLNEALKKAKEIQNTKIEGKCYNTMGLIYLNQKQYNESIKQFNKDVSICSKKNDISGLIGAYMNIGIAQQYLRSYEEGMKYFQLALDLSRKNKINDMKLEAEEKLENLNQEIKLRQESKKLELQLQKQPKFNENLSCQYCQQQFDLEEFQSVIQYTAKILENNQNNIKMLVFKAMAEDKSQKYKEAKVTYEKILQILKVSGEKTTEYAQNLIEYANVLDEMQDNFVIVEQHYIEAQKIALKLDDVYTQKVILENLDILYEKYKKNILRKKSKLEYNKLLKNNTHLKQSSSSKKNNESSSSSENDSYISEGNSDEEEEEEVQVNFKVSSARNQTNQNKKQSGKVLQQKKKVVPTSAEQKSCYMEEEDENDLDFTFCTNKKSQKFKMSDDEDGNNDNSYYDDENRTNNKKINKNLIKEKQNQSQVIVQKQVEASNTRGKDLFSVINSSFIIVQDRAVAESNISEIYMQKCKKYFIQADDELLKIVQSQSSSIDLKKRYYTSLKLVPFFKTIRLKQGLEQLNLSRNLLDNVSLKQLNLSKYYQNLTTLNLAYNNFIYDQLFFDFLAQSKDLLKLKSLNISGLSIAQNEQDCCWHQILLFPQLETLKFKYSSLDHLPHFLPEKILQTKLDEIILKHNQFNNVTDNVTDNVYSDLLHLREFKKFQLY